MLRIWGTLTLCIPPKPWSLAILNLRNPGPARGKIGFLSNSGCIIHLSTCSSNILHIYIYIITSPPASCPRDCCDFNGSPTKLPVCCWKICCPCRKACSMASDPRTPAARHWWSQWAPIVASQSLGGARKIEEMRRRCDPNSVGYKNYSQAWGIFSQNGLSYKMPIHFQQPWKTDELEYCHSLSLRNARLFVKKKPVEAHTFLTKCLCCLDHVLLLQNAKNPMKLIMFSYKMPLRFSRWGNMIKMNPFFNEIHKFKLHNFGPGFHVTVSLTKMEASLRGTRPQTL